MQKLTKIIAAYLLLLCLSPLTYAAISASIDRSMIASDETFTLFITSDSVFKAINPDLSPLNKNFEVVGTSNASSVNVINGKQTSKQQLMITLMPKHTGHLVIPALTIGKNTTKPLYITVKPPLQIPQSQQNLFLETSLNHKTTYPNVQTIYTVKLFYNLNALSGNLSLPNANGLHFEPMGQQTQYSVHRNGKNYQVAERRYAVFADKPGTYKISGVRFIGESAGTNNSNTLFQLTGGKPVHAEANTVTLTVKSIPAHSGNWLPAQNLTITQQWSPNPPVFKVGNPITRTITISALGLPANQLPDLQMQNVPDTNSYPDQPVVQTVNDGNNIQGTKTFKVAYIPTHTGNVTFPAISIQWWNTKTNRFQTATLPTQKFTITPDTSGVQTPAMVTPQPQQPKKTTTASNEKESSHYDLWAWLAGLFFAAWIITLVYFYLRKNNTSIATQQSNDSVRKIRQQLKQACDSNNAASIKQALIVWAQQHWPNTQIKSLGDIKQQNIIEPFKKALQELDAAIYKNHTQQVNGESVWQAFLANEKHKPDNKSDKNSLPPLHLK